MKSEKKNECGNPWNEYFGFKCGTPIMFGPIICIVIQRLNICQKILTFLKIFLNIVMKL
jgi:hypothetical protein